MTNLSVIENKISSVKKYLKILTRYKKYSRDTIERDIDIRGAVERYLYLTIQATIDLAEAVVAYKNLRKPATMSEAFYILNEEGIIPEKLTEKLAKMTGFRNILAHDYEKIDYAIVHNALNHGVLDISSFVKKISRL